MRMINAFHSGRAAARERGERWRADEPAAWPSDRNTTRPTSTSPRKTSIGS